MLALIEETTRIPGWWMWLGFLGQGVFGARFLVQWIVSERKRQVVVPVAFWYLSFSGAVVTLVYALGNGDYPIAMGQCSGLVVYSRNLYLHFSHQRSLTDIVD